MGKDIPVRFDQLFDSLESQCPGLTKGAALNAIRRAVYDFCNRTEAWTEQLDAFNLVSGQVAYTLDIGTQAFIKRILEVRTLSADDVTNGTDGTEVNEELFTFDPPSTLTLDDTIEPGASVTGGLVVKAVLMPNFLAVEIPSWFYNRHAAGIIAGAIYNLKTTPDYLDVATAPRYKAELDQAVNQAMGDAARGYKVGGGLEA